MPSLHVLHERTFAGKPLHSFKVYEDPFGEPEVCVELVFADGQVACLCIGQGRPQIVSSELCYELSPHSSCGEIIRQSLVHSDNDGADMSSSNLLITSRFFISRI